MALHGYYWPTRIGELSVVWLRNVQSFSDTPSESTAVIARNACSTHDLKAMRWTNNAEQKCQNGISPCCG
jgi:hypothetical protein